MNAEVPDWIVAEIVNVGRLLSARGWVPATSGNFSRRIDTETVAITASGMDKGELTPADIRRVVLGAPLAPGLSAETPLHLALYQDNPDIGAVLHTHSVAATVVSLAHAKNDTIALAGYEVVKGLRGHRSHEETGHLPLFENSQDMDALAKCVRARLKAESRVFGFLLAGHGLYAWGETMAEARRHLEAYEFLLICELERGRYHP